MNSIIEKLVNEKPKANIQGGLFKLKKTKSFRLYGSEFEQVYVRTVKFY